MCSSVSACDQDVTYLNSGDSAPCNGYLFSPEKEFEVRVKVEENKYLTKIVDNQKILIDNLKEQNDIYETRKNLNDLEKFAYFIGGALITALVAKNIDK